MYWFRMRHLDALPPGRCYIYCAGYFGAKLRCHLEHHRRDIAVLGFFDTYRQGECDGLPVFPFDRFDHDGADYDYFVVASEKSWQEIMYVNTRGAKKPFYVALPQCLTDQSPAEQNLDAYAAVADRRFVPTSFCLQVSARCNAACMMCPSQPKLKNPFMPEALVDRLLAEIAVLSPGATVYLSTGYGEPLLNPNLETIIAKAVCLGLGPIVTTNAILLTKERTQSCLAAGLKSLYISFSGHNAESYQSVYGNKHFHTVIKNIADACAVAATFGPDYMVANIGCFAAKDNQDFLAKAYKSYDLLRRLGMPLTNINFGFPQNRGHLLQKFEFRQQRSMHTVLDSFAPLTQYCHALASIGINADGMADLCYCSSRAEPDTMLGNIYETDLKTLASHPKRVNMFKEFRDMQHPSDSLCRYCDAPYMF